MIKYKFSLRHPASHYINVELFIDNISSDSLQLQLPAWRPGRYELGNFAKNIKCVTAFDLKGNECTIAKNTKDHWTVNTKGVNEITISYSYYAFELNAGACFADENQLYVNPVHLCMYVPGRTEESHSVELHIPDNYRIATALRKDGKILIAKNYDELADSPLMASDSIKSDMYEVNGIKFFLHFNGDCKPDFTRIKTHFTAFTKKQIEFFGAFPVDEFHFLIQVLPFRFYHGVEHEKSTVIVLGPSWDINSGKTYEDLLGVCSHELFHTWNIKSIRPAEMLPYDFTKENYARTGYVYEGFTTYYGDIMLRASNVFTDAQYFETLEERLTKHFHNYGRFNLSVADSSYDTWLDGYAAGAPFRKTSIYDEGNLIAFMLDIIILKNSGNKKSLKDVCREMYNKFGRKKAGYHEEDIISLCEGAAGIPLKDFFEKFVNGTTDYEPTINECLDYVGLEVQKSPSQMICESLYGFKLIEQPGICKTGLIAPGSPAFEAGLSTGDDIIAVNDFIVKGDSNGWLRNFKHSEIELTVGSQGKLKKILLAFNGGESYFDTFKLIFQAKRTLQQEINYKKWLLENA